MSKTLTEKEWLAWTGPFFWINHSSLLPEGMKENKAVRDIMIKWAAKHSDGWVTFIDGYWMFEYKADAAKLKAAVITGYFQNDMGEL